MSHESPRPNAGQAERLVSIDVLRGLAILAVLAIHIPHYTPGGWREHRFFWLSFLADFGYLGVPLFVVISGFCIHRLAAKQQASGNGSGISWISFWKRRFWRLYPPYLAAVALSIATVFATKGQWVQPLGEFRWDLLSHLGMFHNLTHDYSTSLGNGAFWSLGMEEQLYGLYAVLLLLVAQWRWRKALLIVVGIAVLWRVLSAVVLAAAVGPPPYSVGSWHQWPFAYWLHWTLGALAVDASFGNVRLPRWARSSWTIVVCGVVGFATNLKTWQLLDRTSVSRSLPGWLTNESSLQLLSQLGELAFAFGGFAMVNWALHRERQQGSRSGLARCTAALGRISYSVYLTHIPVLALLETYVPFGHSERDWVIRYVVYLPIVLAVGMGFYWSVERWFVSMRPRTLAESATSSQISNTPLEAPQGALVR
jgi:peptidoglycan/LPS O-acetylase OafA/YrhL